MVEPLSTKESVSGYFVKRTNPETNLVEVVFKQITKKMGYHRFRGWKPLGKAEISYKPVTELGFCKKIQFWIILRQRIFGNEARPRGVRGLTKYQFFKRKVTISVRDEFPLVYLMVEPSLKDKPMKMPMLRDFGERSTASCPLSTDVNEVRIVIKEGKWQAISQEQAQELFMSQKSLLVNRVREEKNPDASTTSTYSFAHRTSV